MSWWVCAAWVRQDCSMGDIAEEGRVSDGLRRTAEVAPGSSSKSRSSTVGSEQEAAPSGACLFANPPRHGMRDGGEVVCLFTP